MIDDDKREAQRRAFARKLNSALQERSMDQKDLASKSTMPRQLIANYAAGLMIPTPKSLKRIASALDIEPSELFDRSSVVTFEPKERPE